jgi:uncharacterized protein YecT (DUF1311 family)
MKKYAFLLVLAGAASIAHAEAQYSAEYSKCMDKAAGVTADTITCIGTEVAQQDKKLNANYKALKASLNPTRQKQLQEVQKIWLNFRDSNCQFYADPEGGSLQRVLANECVLKLTTQRAQELVDLRELL